MEEAMKRGTRNHWMAFMACAVSLSTACDGTPVRSLNDSFSLVVEKSTGDTQPVAIDFLWVVDNSTSMCEEQVSLTANFDQFTDALRAYGDFDPRVAVVTMDAQCDPSNPVRHVHNKVSKKG